MGDEISIACKWGFVNEGGGKQKRKEKKSEPMVGSLVLCHTDISVYGMAYVITYTPKGRDYIPILRIG